MTSLRTDTDRTHLARAVEIAEQGRGRVSPNPLVGAVLVNDGEVLGEGWHAEYGGPPAKRNAISPRRTAPTWPAPRCTSKLEPCCHDGKTPPCTDAIVEAGIARVVVASDDPTEKASGRGLGILRDEGIEVEVADGELAARARLLNQPFRKHARTGPPARRLQVGDDARRQGRHPHRRLEVDLRRGLAPARATAGAPSATPWSSASAPRWPTTRSSPHLVTSSEPGCAASRTASSSTP